MFQDILAMGNGGGGGSLTYLGKQTATVNSSTGSVTFSKDIKILCGNLSDYTSANQFVWDSDNGDISSGFTVTVSGNTAQIRTPWSTNRTASIHAWG